MGLLSRIRFIPAGAGNTHRWSSSHKTWSVHPRGCGEHACRSSPSLLAVGSSPRVRGTQNLHIPLYVFRRFIPAGAGNTHPPWCSTVPSPVHPRGCGEHSLATSSSSLRIGSSPRVRGTHIGDIAHYLQIRFIPAGAGNTTSWLPRPAAPPVHPRGCGEHAADCAAGRPHGGSSPRVRGTQTAGRGGTEKMRFIPAGAGNTAPSSPR